MYSFYYYVYINGEKDITCININVIAENDKVLLDLETDNDVEFESTLQKTIEKIVEDVEVNKANKALVVHEESQNKGK